MRTRRSSTRLRPNLGAGVVGIGGVMYDRPHLARAQRLLAQATKQNAP